MSSRIIALDADGVLLDYHAAYRLAWQRAFGELPELRDPLAYWAMDRWGVKRLEAAEMEVFQACFDEDFWASIPPLSGAVEACNALVAAGYELVCVSALKPRLQAERLRNLRACGFPIETVIATAAETTTGDSPKAEVLESLRPAVFVDDFLPFFRGIPETIHAALVVREPNGSPNVGAEVTLLTDTQHPDLAHFVEWWLEQTESL